MAEELLLGIDIGTTILKMAVYDSRTGVQRGAGSARLTVHTARDGTSEQKPAAIERAMRRIISEMRKQLGRKWDRIHGVGIGAQGGSAIIADRHSGRALTSMQLWNDYRPRKYQAEISALKGPGYWRRISYLSSCGMGLARMKWLRERHPSLFNDNNIYVGAGEFAYFKLTDVWRQDAGHALQTGCYNSRKFRLAPEPLRLVGVNESFVAPMRDTHKTHPLSPKGAKFLALPPLIPVAGPYMDHESGYLSAVSLSKKPLQCSLGTAWVGNYISAKNTSPPPGMNLVLPAPLEEGSLVVRVMGAGNKSWDWALATLVNPRQKKALLMADAIFTESLLPPQNLTALPWLTQPHVFTEHSAGGGFLGVNTHTTQEDMLRALAAGMCFQMAHTFQPVIDEGTVDSVVLAGGAARGWYFRKILAALFAPLPVFHLADDETTGTRGALFAFSRKAATPRTKRVKRPSGALRDSIYNEYKLFRGVCARLSRAFPKSRSIMTGK